jgi:shikimate kinase
MKIFLVGSMRAGKKKIGKILAYTLHLPFLDMDNLIEVKEKKAIARIFEEHGEKYFRRREAQVLNEIINLQNIVVATEGRIVVSKENFEKLKAQERVVYLKAHVKNQLSRLKNDSIRPVLRTNDRIIKLLELEKIRTPLYESIAKIIIDTNSSFINEIIKKLKAVFLNTKENPENQGEICFNV